MKKHASKNDSNYFDQTILNQLNNSGNSMDSNGSRSNSNSKCSTRGDNKNDSLMSESEIKEYHPSNPIIIKYPTEYSDIDMGKKRTKKNREIKSPVKVHILLVLFFDHNLKLSTTTS